MENYSLINFLNRIIYLEEKFNNLLIESKNFTKKNKEDFSHFKNNLINNIIIELLPINDSMEMFAKTFFTKNKEEIEILILIFKMLKKFNTKFEIKQISKIGVLFNPEIHEAIGVVQNSILKKGTINSILQTGYIRRESLLRPALVIVNN